MLRLGFAALFIISCNGIPDKRNRGAVGQEFPIGAFTQNDTASKRYFMKSERLNDSISICEFIYIGDDTSLQYQKNDNLYFLLNYSKIYGGYRLCDSLNKQDILEWKNVSDTTSTFTLKVGGELVLDTDTFTLKRINLNINDGVEFDPDYFFRIKKQIKKDLMLKFYKYPTSYSETHVIRLNDSIQDQFLVDHSVFCEKSKRNYTSYICIGFAEPVPNHTIFKHRYGYEHEYWLPLDTFNRYFEHW